MCLGSEGEYAHAGADIAGDKKHKGPTGKQFFRQLEADAKAKVRVLSSDLLPLH